MRNSFLIATMAMLVCTSLPVIGAYALSSLRWRGRSTFGLFLLVTQMLPEMLIVIPLYVLFRRLNLLDNIPTLSLIDAAFALPICIWILKNVFDTMPEVLDAGCRRRLYRTECACGTSSCPYPCRAWSPSPSCLSFLPGTNICLP